MYMYMSRVLIGEAVFQTSIKINEITDFIAFKAVNKIEK